MELLVSKFRLINGDAYVNTSNINVELTALQIQVDKDVQPSNKDLIIYAYKFINFNQKLMAQSQLNKLSSGYYDMMIYKDLCHSTMTNNTFLSIVKQSLILFDDLTFIEKSAFYRFRREFQRVFITLT